ncbi:MAG TPA: hypothetical protein VND99_01045 [Candidatus Acidoferrales bacterium]|nr:hypothetical protein [Candidatus Acidoferrales bacterium]
MKIVRRLLSNILLLLPYLIVFIFSLYQPSDPDLGWHLKYGQYFWQHGTLLRDNTFSTMMPHFHWANTSWLTDIISYTAYHFGGLFGLTLLGALVITLTFYFFAQAANLTLWEQTTIFPLILYLEEQVNIISFRGQMLSTLFVGILFYFISLYEKKPKLLWLAIPLFWVWVDVDGEFLLGYALFACWVFLYVISRVLQYALSQNEKQKKSLHLNLIRDAFSSEKNTVRNLCIILLCSFVATFINPFGYGIHLDALSHLGNPLLLDIGEYLPFDFFSLGWWNQLVVGIILVFGLFILFFRNKFWRLFPYLGGGLILFILSIHIKRYVWPAYYLLFPLFAMSAAFLKPDKKKITTNSATIILLATLLVVVWMRYPFSNYSKFDWDGYCRTQILPCTSQSAEFLITHHLTHNLYSMYNWGGWLIWNYPQIKPTIDGRMHLWEQNGYSAFTDYYTVEQNEKDIDKTTYSVVYASPDKPVYDRLIQLVKQKRWKEVYKDKYTAIFVRLDRGMTQN